MTVLLLAGPTASGKSALALALAERYRGTIVNADSMQVYRELRVLTARPSAADESKVPHALYGIVSVAEVFSVAAWLARAVPAIEGAAAGGPVIVVGGTGLYFEALLHGIASVPEIPAAVRREVRALIAVRGPGAAHEALLRCDPTMAARLHPADAQRLARALEVVIATGRSLVAWQAETRPALSPRVPLVKVVLEPPRAPIYERIKGRYRSMVAGGGLAEVAALPHGDAELPALKALGVPELGRHLAGALSREEAILAGQRAVRRYAKRQYTWFRHRMADWHRVPAFGEDAPAAVAALLDAAHRR
ncbi:MAG: tRNA (adenosine(37)-N6)-dimethylallyltransferase MiaA [Alphaproteobacteria bacterium]|nr:tRNA (adenosine(37)-N6)-dimethylallyltransferase MiaA [Alphaproteobacteria bacterium]